jgi:acetyltransferase
LAEPLRDTAVGLPPLNSTLARRLIEQTRIASALQGNDQKPGCNLAELERIIVALGDLLVEQPRIRELDINPLFATPQAITALDARIVLRVSADDSTVPAIRPYPLEYVRTAMIDDGTQIRLRPIRLEDEPAMIEFHKTLSEDSVRHRYFGLTSLSRRTNHERLIRHCLNDFERQAAIVAESVVSNEILGVGRLSRERRSPTAEFSLVVADAWQRRGIGRLLLDHLIAIGRQEGVERLTATMLGDNTAMFSLCRTFAFTVCDHPSANSVVRADSVLHMEHSLQHDELEPREDVVL